MDPVKRTPLEIKFGNDLMGRCLAAYWTDRQALIDDRCRMRAVVEVIAEEVRRWAPDKGQAKICHLAINEVADRLLRDTNDL